MGKIVEYKVEHPHKKEKADDTIILSNRLYVPEHLVTRDIRNAFTYTIGHHDERCECSDPTTCPRAEMQTIEMWKEFRDGEYYGFARGDLRKLKQYFDWSKVDDQRSRSKMKVPIKFIGTLYPNQEKTINQWLERKYGILKSPPRSGKTVMCANITAKFGYQTLILVHQDELAQQFYNTFMNLNRDKEGKRIRFTNAPLLEKETKKTIVGIVTSLRDLEKDWSVSIMTYQKFLRHIPELKKMRDKWGMVFVDECHLSAATRWSEILNILNPKIRWGCSATPKRKDETHVVAENILGPITAEGSATQLKVGIEYIQTGYIVPTFFRWTTLINRMSKDDDRNELIADRIAKDADAGHSVLATTTRVSHAREIGRLLDMQGYKVAVITGATFDRKTLFTKFKTKELQILIASRQITQVGLDLPVLSCQHLVVPNMNPYNLEQEASRCLTPYPGKREPVIRAYLDHGHKVCYAIKSSFNKVLNKFNSYLITDEEYKSKIKYKGW